MRWRRKTDEMQKHVTLESYIRKLQVMFLIPVAGMVFVTFVVLFSYVGQYSEILPMSPRHRSSTRTLKSRST